MVDKEESKTAIRRDRYKRRVWIKKVQRALHIVECSTGTPVLECDLVEHAKQITKIFFYEPGKMRVFNEFVYPRQLQLLTQKLNLIVGTILCKFIPHIV